MSKRVELDDFAKETLYYMQIAVGKALKRHKQLYQPIYVCRDGEVVKIPARQIKPVFPEGYNPRKHTKPRPYAS